MAISKEDIDKIFPNDSYGAATTSDLVLLVKKLEELGYLVSPPVAPVAPVPPTTP